MCEDEEGVREGAACLGRGDWSLEEVGGRGRLSWAEGPSPAEGLSRAVGAVGLGGELGPQDVESGPLGCRSGGFDPKLFL